MPARTQITNPHVLAVNRSSATALKFFIGERYKRGHTHGQNGPSFTYYFQPCHERRIPYLCANLFHMVTSRIQAIIEQEVQAIRNIPIDGVIQEAVDIIHEQVHKKGGKLVVSGMGKAGQIGVNIATTLSSTGTPSIFLHPAESQHGDLGMVQPNDVMFLISNSGKTREIVEMEHLVKAMYPEIKIIGLTGSSTGNLAKFSDVVLYTGDPKEVCPLGLAPTTSTTVMTVVGDVLVVMMMEKIGFTKEEYAKRHHSGYLGVQARKK